MEPKRFSLCPLCTECPEVVITDTGRPLIPFAHIQVYVRGARN